jgi:hypothetical protein
MSKPGAHAKRAGVSERQTKRCKAAGKQGWHQLPAMAAVLKQFAATGEKP